MTAMTRRMLATWGEAASSGRPIEIGPEMKRLTLAIAGLTLFDRDMSDASDSIAQAFGIGTQFLEHRFNRPFTTPPYWAPTPGNLAFKRAIRRLNEIVLTLVRDRRRDGLDHGDLLSMLLQARDEETGETMTDEQVRSEVLAFLLAGHETTAIALTWTWYLLAAHPDVQQRVREQIDQVVADRAPVLADLPQLTMTQMVIDEAMRLYPPIWAVPRQAIEDDEIGGFEIPAGSTVLVSQFVTHRHPDVWEEPDTFIPERFTAERVAARPKGAYFPFLSGPHQCIGNEFAMQEMRLIVATVLQSFELRLSPGQSIQPQASLTLRPSGPVNVAVRPVSRAAAIVS
jgi:cytochrome P450